MKIRHTPSGAAPQPQPDKRPESMPTDLPDNLPEPAQVSVRITDLDWLFIPGDLEMPKNSMFQTELAGTILDIVLRGLGGARSDFP